MKITRRRLEIFGAQFNADAGFKLIDKSKTEGGNGLRIEMKIPFKR
jgi:hypothetical protein